MRTKLLCGILLFVFQACLVNEAFSQKWKKDKPNTLYAVSKKNKAETVLVGIGLKNPTAQLHTKGTVRLEGLVGNTGNGRFLTVDSNGNVSWRDMVTPNNSPSWLLTGNNAGSTNFIGTINNEDFRIRTNNQQRVVVDNAGHVGINNPNPVSVLDIAGSAAIRPGSGNTLPNAPGLVLYQNTNVLSHGAYIAFSNAVNKKSFDLIFGGRCGAPGDDLNFIYYPNRDVSCTDGQYIMTMHENKVGIGTTSPTARLHTNGSVRMESLSNDDSKNRILVTDNDGNIFYRNASSLGGGSGGWNTNGNNITTNDYIGTNNNESFRIRTNNVQRVVVDSLGHVGINNTAPKGMLDVAGSLVVRAGNGATLPNAPGLIIEQNSNTLAHGGYIAFNNAVTNRSYDIIQGGLCGSGGDDLNFIYYPNRQTSCNNGAYVLTMRQNKVGINVNNPTAVFHTNGSVRLENLTTGAGNILVADANGNVFLSTQTSSRVATEDIEILKAEVETLKAQVAELKSIMTAAGKISPAVMETTNQARLFQNAPNPFNSNTVIRYALPEGMSGTLQVADMNGNIIKTWIANASGQVTLTAGELPSGTYYYSLVVNNKTVDTKKMILVR